MTTPSPRTLRRLVELACRAPSVHNTQPWLWRLPDATTVDLYADRTRQLAVADPDGRNLALSCGAALHHAESAAQALGMDSKAELLPDASDQDLLGRLHLGVGVPPADAQERLDILAKRCTDRRRFTSWPIPEARLHALAGSTSGWGAWAVPIAEPAARLRAELLLERALATQAGDPALVEEQADWVQHGSLDGVPAEVAVPPATSRTDGHPNRFAREQSGRGARVVESSDGLMAICSAGDTQAEWLRAGQALSALWLEATRGGLSVVPLSQVIEVPSTRRGLRHDVLDDVAHPQLLLRIGWQEISRATLPRTPRRPLGDVLLP